MPCCGSAQDRTRTLALLKVLIFQVDGRALSPAYAWESGRHYRYCVAQRALKSDAAADAGISQRMSAAEMKAALVD